MSGHLGEVSSHLASIRERISRAGRDPDEVTIVAVTKGFGAATCRVALDLGLNALGENRVQEALGKMDQVEGADWHLIGHLQTNKVKLAAGKFALIQTIDSLHVAEAIAHLEPNQRVLVQVNVAMEVQKSGVYPTEASQLIDAVAGLLDVRGLMAMGPSHRDPKPAFDDLRRLRDEAEQRIGKKLPVLSMGMSGDFEAALAAGSTMLRLGQALFGPRTS